MEQAHVDRVYERLAEATRSAQQVASAGRDLFQSDRTNFVREENGTGLYERDVFAFQTAKRLATLDAEHEGLVFGRLDRTDGEVRYVGRLGVRDAEYEPLVIDWRARAAEPFYRATPADPMEVSRRRVLRCRGDRVIGIEDDLLDDRHADGLVVVGEGALMAALSRARGHTMRDIVATIQAQQDEAIRAPWQGFTMISGGPGTGKTVVALHRAAYLLYSHRKRLAGGGVLVVGPSQVFMNYIERVLPSLGEDSVTLRSVGDVAADVLPDGAVRVDSADAARIKGSLRMLPLLRRVVDEPLQPDTEQRLQVTVKGYALNLATEAMQRVRRRVLRHHKVNNGRDAAAKGLLEALWELKPDELDVDRDTFDELVTDSASWRMFQHAWWPALSAPQVLARLGDRGLVGRLAADLLDPDEHRALAESYPAGAEWSVADTALLDELVHLLGPLPPDPEDSDVSLFLADGSQREEVVTTMDRLRPEPEEDPFAEQHETYAHILVDEAQDITPMQWRMLRRRGSQASWTIVGDPAQSSWPDAEESARALTDLIGNAPVRHFRMDTNYRSPAEVFSLAAEVVVRAFPDADLPEAVRSTGFEPELLTAAGDDPLPETVAAVARLAEEVEGTLGVICPPSLLPMITSGVAGTDTLASVGDRIRVVTPLQSKGLEYDAVVVVSPDDIVAESPGGVRVLYVALTRPTQRLVTIDRAGSPADWRGSRG
ncbi:MAG: HelD family protein [Propionibacteriaceae bacterium]